MSDDISVITPTYNRANTLSRAIESVLNQTVKDIKHIIVDDGSTDNTPELIERYDDSQIEYHQLDTNQGACVARNVGIELADSKYVSFLDSDDAFRPTYIETILETFSAAPSDCGGVYTSYAKRQNSHDKSHNVHQIKPGVVSQEAVIRHNPIGSLSATTFHIDAINEVGGFDPSFKARQDLDLYVRILDKYKMVGVDEILLDYYEHDDRITENIDRRMQGHERFLQKHNEKMSEAAIAYTHYSRGHTYVNNGDLQTAQHHFWKAMSKDPTNPRYPYSYLAACLGPHAFDVATSFRDHISNIIRNV